LVLSTVVLTAAAGCGAEHGGRITGERRSAAPMNQCALSQLRLRFDGDLIGGQTTVVNETVSTRGSACVLRKSIAFRIDHPDVEFDGNPARIRLRLPITSRGTLVLFPVGNWCKANTTLSGVVAVGTLSKRIVGPLANGCPVPGRPPTLSSEIYGSRPTP